MSMFTTQPATFLLFFYLIALSTANKICREIIYRNPVAIQNGKEVKVRRTISE